MGDIRHGYGSECHLLRYLGRHRSLLVETILAATGGRAIDWLDFGFDRSTAWGDGELKGLDFLTDGAVKKEWKACWPQRGNQPNWDAIGRLDREGPADWLLIEAKANVEELQNSCGANEGDGKRRIMKTLTTAKNALGVAPDRDWLNGYYQLANRLAMLQFLVSNGVPARLALIYFVGDRNPIATCPDTVEEGRYILPNRKSTWVFPQDIPCPIASTRSSCLPIPADGSAAAYRERLPVWSLNRQKGCSRQACLTWRRTANISKTSGSTRWAWRSVMPTVPLGGSHDR